VAKEAESPLAGKTVVITRAAMQGAQLGEELAERGARIRLLPLVAFGPPEDYAPLDAALRRLEEFGWILFTSANAVDAVARRGKKLGRDLNRAGREWRIGAVGPATKEEAEKNGMAVDYTAKTHTGAALAEELKERLNGRKVFLPRSDRANPDFPAALRRHGAQVTEAVAYRTMLPSETKLEEVIRAAEGGADAVVFYSPSAVQHFAEIVGPERLTGAWKRMAMAAVGPVTAEALRKLGVRKVVVAEDTTARAVVEALERHFAETNHRSTAGAQRA
jgi:uroporphyrinogen-III synthase